MKAIIKHTRYLLLGLLLLSQQTFRAQELFTSSVPVIITPHAQRIDYSERVLCYTIKSNVEFSVSSDADWVKVAKQVNKTVYLHVAQNMSSVSRTANITFTTSDEKAAQVMVLTQTRDESASEIPTDYKIKPSSATGTKPQSGADISKTYDDDYTTMYHTQWSGYTVSESDPAILNYKFTNVEQIDYLTYVPRQTGGDNGNFGRVRLYVTEKGSAERLYGTYNWEKTGSSKSVVFDTPLQNPTSIRFEVLDGAGGFASCAEMEFYRVNTELKNDLSIFADDIYSELKEGVTQDDIDNLENPFVKSLATQIFNKTYSTEYRVATYEAFSSPEYWSDKWNAPGKYYDHCEGVTGINITQGKQAIAVSGIPASLGAISLRVVAWFSKDLNDKGEGAGPEAFTFTLKNGLNIIEYKGAKDALAYINYFIYGEPTKDEYPDVKVHFINGQVNGYLSKKKTNDEMHLMCKNAPNRCIDVVGDRVHSVWEANGMYQYCKTSTNQAKGYRQYINVLDSLLVWEHRLLGFEKYNRIPRNHTMAYVNYTYYMFQGYYGVSFKYDTQSRVLNCQTLMKKDDDAIWGLSHEWGHQHQMQPYFCWGSLGEVSNNMNSYYNIQAMGYHGESDKIQSYWPNGRAQALRDEPYKNGTTYVPKSQSQSYRRLAYLKRSNFGIADYKTLAEMMSDSLIYPVSDDVVTTWKAGGVELDVTKKMLGISHSEMGGEALTPFVMLYLYASRNWRTDFAPDLYEALRQTDEENGSVIEKTDGVDKYELLASAQNGNKNSKYSVFKQKYPNSCWITRNYISSSGMTKNGNTVPFIFNFIRKCSRLTGKNLFPYFEKWGFLRTIALEIGDYGTYYYMMTPPMYYEFKEDMQQLVTDGVLEDIDEATITAISNSKDLWEVEFGTTPNIPNE